MNWTVEGGKGQLRSVEGGGGRCAEMFPDPLSDKELHELIQTIDQSGYFDKPSATAEGEEEEEDLVSVCMCGGVYVCMCVGCMCMCVYGVCVCVCVCHVTFPHPVRILKNRMTISQLMIR